MNLQNFYFHSFVSKRIIAKYYYRTLLIING